MKKLNLKESFYQNKFYIFISTYLEKRRLNLEWKMNTYNNYNIVQKQF